MDPNEVIDMSGRVADYIDKYYNEKHCNCAETIFCSAMEAWGLNVPADSSKLLAGFGGGLGVGIICGGVAGGCAALSCKSDEWDEDRERRNTRRKIRAFIRLVRDRHGSENCVSLRPQFFSAEERCFQTINHGAEALDEVYEAD